MCAVQRGMGGAVLQAQDLSRSPGAKAQGTEGEKPGQYPAGRATLSTAPPPHHRPAGSQENQKQGLGWRPSSLSGASGG